MGTGAIRIGHIRRAPKDYISINISFPQNRNGKSLRKINQETDLTVSSLSKIIDFILCQSLVYKSTCDLVAFIIFKQMFAIHYFTLYTTYIIQNAHI
jgi:hypothetical protein